MKKVLVLVFVAFTTIATYALDLYEYKVFYKLNNEKTLISLSRYLKTDKQQQNQLKSEFRLTEQKIRSAIEKENEFAAEEAMNSNLEFLKQVLTIGQYDKFIQALHVTIENSRVIEFAELSY